MTWETVTFLAQTVAISLSGVLAPGPVTAAALAGGARNRHAGAWMAVGHGIIEFPLMLLIMGGAGVVLTAKAFRVGVGLAGGAALLLMALMILASLRRTGIEGKPPAASSPLWTGVVLTGGNPYFLVWWATVGLAMTTRAVELGVLAFGIFAVAHWLCDLIWLEILSLASHRGAGVFGATSQRVVLGICSAAMVFFGVKFVADAVRMMRM